MSIETILSQLASKRRERLTLQEKANKLEQEEKNLQAELDALGAAEGQYGSYYLRVKAKQVPRAVDWNAFYKYVHDNNAFDMLHKRLTETAIMARVREGEIIPGIVTDDKKTYSVEA